MTKIMKAAPVVNKALLDLESRCGKLKKRGIHPLMKVILVGSHKPSLIYVRNKKKFCERFGARCDIVELSETISRKDFLLQLEKIAGDTKVHGCFVQLPLPKRLDAANMADLIPSHKDVDGMGPANFFHLACGDRGEKALLPCTPKGMISLLTHYKIPIAKKNVVVVGRSMIVGKPAALLFCNYHATVTLCHSQTQNLPDITSTADVLVVAVGRAKFINSSHIDEKRKPIIIDAGINDLDGKLCGDVDYEDVHAQVGGITPVPGGVGPMTILSLAQNLLQAAEKGL